MENIFYKKKSHLTEIVFRKRLFVLQKRFSVMKVVSQKKKLTTENVFQKSDEK